MVACPARFQGAALAAAPAEDGPDPTPPLRAERRLAGRVGAEDALGRVRTAIDGLPPLARAVVTMPRVQARAGAACNGPGGDRDLLWKQPPPAKEKHPCRFEPRSAGA